MTGGNKNIYVRTNTHLPHESRPERSRLVGKQELEGLAQGGRGGRQGVEIHKHCRVSGDHAGGVAEQHRQPLRQELAVLAVDIVTCTSNNIP